jgi:DNA topoisomerase-2
MEDFNFDKHISENNYNYLIKMPMDSVSKENAEKILREHKEKNQELENIKIITIETMWLNELNELKIAYKEFLELYNEKESTNLSTKKSKK